MRTWAGAEVTPGSDRLNNKGDRACHPKGQTDIQIPCQPAHLFAEVPTEEEVSRWLSPGSAPWYYAQGLTPPQEEAEKGGKG